MKNKIGLLLVLALCLSVISTVSASTGSSIEGFYVVQDDHVITHLNNFPKNETFIVQMGLSDSLGEGYLVSKLTTNAGGDFDAEFRIPDELKGEEVISIRLDSITSNKFFFDAFFNQTGANYSAATTSTSGTTYNNWNVGDPQFSVLKVEKGSSITVQTKYFPEGVRYAVFMKDGALANKTWYEVDGFNSTSGGIQTLDLSIPSALQYKEKIAVKFYSLKDGFVTYNLVLNQDYP